jgi:diguanylate cyclase (GGDEF)-like protein/PAS domain S-box-containing protein
MIQTGGCGVRRLGAKPLNRHNRAARWAGAQEDSFLKTIVDAVPGAVAYWDPDLICRFANASCMDWFGKSPETVLGTHYRSFVNEDFFRANLGHIRAALAGEKPCFELTAPGPDGTVRHVFVNYIPDIDPNGDVAGFFLLATDVTHLKDAEAQVEVGTAVFEYAADGIMVTDANGSILSVNPAFTEITGYTHEEAVGRNPRFLKSDRQDRLFYEAMWSELLTCGRWQGELWNRRKSGEIFLEHQTIRMIRNADNEGVRYVSVFSDFTEAWRKNERIRHLAFHDHLTDLPNRSVLIDSLAGEIAVAGREARCIAVMFIDLDEFKAVNDRFGHDVGDIVLEQVARKLQGLTRSTDLVARVGGDEFVALLFNTRSHEPAARIAQSIIEAINEPLDFDSKHVHVGVSIGIAMYPADGRTAADLIRNADTAMYAAKAAGKNAYRFANIAPAELPAAG